MEIIAAYLSPKLVPRPVSRSLAHDLHPVLTSSIWDSACVADASYVVVDVTCEPSCRAHPCFERLFSLFSLSLAQPDKPGGLPGTDVPGSGRGNEPGSFESVQPHGDEPVRRGEQPV